MASSFVTTQDEKLKTAMKKAYNGLIFQYNPRFMQYVSWPGQMNDLTALLGGLFSGAAKLTVADCFDNDGSSALAFAKLAYTARINTNILVVGEHNISKKVDNNILEYVRRAGGERRVAATISPKSPGLFISSSLKHLDGGRFMRESPINVLHLTPPWNLPAGFDTVKDCGTKARPSAPAKAFTDLLAREVFDPLLKLRYPFPKIVCIKAWARFDELSSGLLRGYLHGYALWKTLAIENCRGDVSFYYHLLTSDPDLLASDDDEEYAPSVDEGSFVDDDNASEDNDDPTPSSWEDLVGKEADVGATPGPGAPALSAQAAEFTPCGVRFAAVTRASASGDAPVLMGFVLKPGLRLEDVVDSSAVAEYCYDVPRP